LLAAELSRTAAATIAAESLVLSSPVGNLASDVLAT
jgi:hypothetical protein